MIACISDMFFLVAMMFYAIAKKIIFSPYSVQVKKFKTNFTDDMMYCKCLALRGVSQNLQKQIQSKQFT